MIDNASIPSSYEALSAKGISPGVLSSSVWLTPNLVGDAFANDGAAPVLTIGFCCFSGNKRVGLYAYVHHELADVAVFSEVFKQRVERTTVSGLGTLIVIGGKPTARPSYALAADS